MTVVRAPMQDDYLGTAIDFAAPLGEPALLAPDSSAGSPSGAEKSIAVPR